jgi:hypothetical protein
VKYVYWVNYHSWSPRRGVGEGALAMTLSAPLNHEDRVTDLQRFIANTFGHEAATVRTWILIRTEGEDSAEELITETERVIDRIDSFSRGPS